MKSFIIAAGFLAFALPAFAQTAPSSNATTLGTSTTSGNGAGAPSAATPQGQVTSTGPSAEAPAVPSLETRPNGVVPQAQHPTADSSVTGATNTPSK